MLTLNDGRAELWQWDTGRTLAVDADCSQVHFSNKVFGRSIDVDVIGGSAIIPDVLLQTDKDLNVWAFVGTAENGYTKISKTFKVNRRNKPADYVFTPTDQMTLHTIQSQIGDLADLTTEAKDTLVAAINEAARTGGGAGSMDLRVADGYVQYSTDSGSTWQNLIAVADLEGADGITPTIGANGNWYLGKTDTGKPSRGDTGPKGEKGEKGDTGDTGPQGIQGPAGPQGPQGEAGAAGADGKDGADGKSAYAYAMEGGYTGTEAEFAAKLAEKMPTALPNPNALTFTGAVTGTYDGSEAKTINIPSGGSGSGAEKTWSLLLDETLSEDTAYIFQDLSAPVTELIIEFLAGGDGTHRDVTIFNRKGVGYGNNIATFKSVLRSDETVAARFVIHCVAFPDLAFFRCQYNNYNNLVGESIINTSSVLLFDNENGAFNGSTNFDCISIGCWSGGNSGVFKAGTRMKVYGKI